MKLEVIARLRMSRKEFEKNVPDYLTGLNYLINKFPSEKNEEFGYGFMPTPEDETLLYFEDMPPNKLEYFLAWGRSKSNGFDRIILIRVNQNYSEDEIINCKYVYCDFHRDNLRVVREEMTFDQKRCDKCGRIDWTQKGDLQLTGRFPKAPFVLTDSYDLLVRSDVAPIFTNNKINMRRLHNKDTHLQCVPQYRFRFITDKIHQYSGEACLNCGVPPGLSLRGDIEGQPPITATSNLIRQIYNFPIKILVSNEAGQNDLIYIAPQALGYVSSRVNNVIQKPYKRSEMETPYVMRGSLIRQLRDSLGWNAIKDYFLSPAIVVGVFKDNNSPF